MLIEIEGPSGAGKSSLIMGLRSDPQVAGRLVVNVGDIEQATDDLGWRTGALMRGIDQPIEPTEAVFLYCARAAARARLVLAENDHHAVVLCDRLRLSLRVQTRLAGIPDPTAEHLVNLAVRGLRPDLVVLLDVSYPAHGRRLAGRGHPAQPAPIFGRTRRIFGEMLRRACRRKAPDRHHRPVTRSSTRQGVRRIAARGGDDMKRFVLTGGHGVGKTSIILALEQLGEYVVFEAASSVRALDRAQGVAFPEDHSDFEARALALHLQRERTVPEVARRIFLDRGAPDHLAYRQIGTWSLSRAEEATCYGARYDAAFLIEPPPGGVPTLGHVEAQFCERLVLAIKQVYRQAGTPLVRVPYGECRNRALFILEFPPLSRRLSIMV